LFSKVSWLKLAEIDPANIDFHSIQNLDDNNYFGQNNGGDKDG
jgi:hypothetical protein